MVFSKPIHAPRKWSEKGKGMLDEEIDAELEGLHEMIDTLTQCDLTTETALRKYRKIVRPCNFTRSIYPVFPNTKLNRELFKTFAHFTIGVFIADDMLEKQSAEETRNTCTIIAHLDEQSRHSFPSFPTICDMKQIVNSFSIPPRLMGPIVFLEQFLNQLASILLLRGDFALNAVIEFRLRAYNMIAIYLQKVLEENELKKKKEVMEVLWRRSFNGSVQIYCLIVEIFSGAIGQIEEHKASLTELYILASIYTTTVNDVYSYFFEVHSTCDNLITAMISNKEAKTAEEAAVKSSEIIDSIVQCMYEKAEKIKGGDPNNHELRDLLDYIGVVTIGFFHIHRLPRYHDSSLVFTLEEVEEDQLHNWLSKKSEYGTRVVKDFLEMTNKRMADGKMDALCGAFPFGKRIFDKTRN